MAQLTSGISSRYVYYSYKMYGLTWPDLMSNIW